MLHQIPISTLELPRYICDFETYSELDVRDVGAARYAEHPSTEILCLGYKKQHGERKIWYPGLDFPQELIDHIEQGFVIEAHNAAFEYWCWWFLLHKQLYLPMPQRWLDTLASCAYRGLPLQLDKVGAVLNLKVQKDKRGKYLLRKLSQPQKPTKKHPETRCRDFTLLEELYGYCLDDCSAEEALGDAIGDLPHAELSMWELDQKINRRGIKVDLELVYRALDVIEVTTSKLTAELRKVTKNEVDTVSQRDKMLDWCRKNGCTGLPNLQAETVEEILKEGWLPENVKRVLQIRQALNHASIKKLIKFRDCVSADGRIRGLLQYHGASTGRWAGRLVQPQNFPRDKVEADLKQLGVKAEEFMEMLVDAIKSNDPDLIELFHGGILDAISTALRGCFIAEDDHKLYVADFSQIEARIVMWLAEEVKALQAFRDSDAGTGQDIYCQMASEIFRRLVTKADKPERQLGKIIILACGYQLGGAKLLVQSEADLARVSIKLSPEEADEYVAKYRTTYPNIPKLWKGLEDAAIYCVENNVETYYKNIRFQMVFDAAGEWLTMILPNKRRLWYFNPGLEEKTIQYVLKKDDPKKGLTAGDVSTFTKVSLFYYGRDNKKGGSWSKVYTYGGMLTENAVQAIARDLMAAAMFRAEKAGYPIVLTVHDELVAERRNDGIGSVHHFEEIVKGPSPKWAAGCPVNAEGFVCTRYRK